MPKKIKNTESGGANMGFCWACQENKAFRRIFSPTSEKRTHEVCNQCLKNAGKKLEGRTEQVGKHTHTHTHINTHSILLANQRACTVSLWQKAMFKMLRATSVESVSAR